MLLQYVLDLLKEYDIHNLFITDMNTEFHKTINSIDDTNSIGDIKRDLTAFFDFYITTVDKNTLFYQEAVKMSGLMAEIARTYSEEMAVTAGDEKEEDTNAVIERINGVIVQNINKKFAAEEEENADQINPSNQQFLSSNQPVSKTEAAPLNNGRFQAEFKKTNEPYKFYYSREEISRMNKKNINEEILDIYMRSLVAFSQDVDVETLNKHIYYLQNDGQWVDDNNQ